MKKPLDTLRVSLGKPVIVALKGHREYRGTLDGYDPHMNLVLKQADVVFEGDVQEKVETILVRGDNVIYISP